MASAIYYRLFGQVLALTVHSINGLVMFISMQDQELLKDPEISTMVSLQSQYLTVWNIIFQMSYFSLAFICDFLTITGREHLVSKKIRKFRQTYFTTFIWPIGMFIFVVFWPFFLINRELMFPAFIDKIFSLKSNLVIHFFIVPVALWELIFLPRPVPKKHTKFLIITSTFFVVYVSYILHTYSQRGLWPYPIMKVLYGTIFFPIAVLINYIIMIVCYFTQWKLISIVWGRKNNSTIKNK